MFLALLIISSAILLSLIILFIFQLFNIIFRGFAPFVSTETEVIKRLLADLNLKDHSVVMELGCGKAGFLHAVEAKFPNLELIGVEHAILPYFMAKLQASLRGSNMHIVRQDLYKADVTRADLIYCYLTQSMMEQLEKKFKFECKRHCRVVSYRFPIPAFNPEKVVEFQETKKQPKFRKLAKFIQRLSKKKKVTEIYRIYFYEMFF